MYEALDAVADDFGHLSSLLADRSADARIAAVRGAIAATAERLSERRAATEQEQAALSMLYRAMLSAQRILVSLQEHYANDPAP
jgi:hypothetical protein